MGFLTLVLLSACASSGDKRESSDGDQKNPAEVNAQLGIEYMRKGMYKDSLQKFKKAVRQNPQLQLAQVSMAILYEQLGEDELAGKHYRKAYSIDPNNTLTLNAYGQYLCRIGKLDRADDMFNTAVKDPLYRRPELIYTNAGICARKRPDMKLADRYFRQALQRNSNYQPALREMIRDSFAQKNHLITRAYLQRLQELTPLTPEFLWIGVRTESALDNKNTMSSYALLLKNRYPESEETQQLMKWERRTGER